jgi:hypothetical protein
MAFGAVTVAYSLPLAEGKATDDAGSKEDRKAVSSGAATKACERVVFFRGDINSADPHSKRTARRQPLPASFSGQAGWTLAGTKKGEQQDADRLSVWLLLLFNHVDP